VDHRAKEYNNQAKKYKQKYFEDFDMSVALCKLEVMEILGFR
jgi:hypothetical protein